MHTYQLLALLAVLLALAVSADAFRPTSRVLGRQMSHINMAVTAAPAVTALASAARDARGLAIDSISAVIQSIFRFHIQSCPHEIFEYISYNQINNVRNIYSFLI